MSHISVIFTDCIKAGYFPIVFKKAIVIPIPKPGKDPSLTSSYRPISLLSNLGKLLEKIILRRLNTFFNENQLISKHQFGFRKEHSTIHEIKRNTDTIRSNKTRKQSTGIMLMDIEKAFDTVWHDGLIHKLLKSSTPIYLCKLI